MKKDQRTSETDKTETVSEGLARQLGRMAEDASRNYPGGTAKAELAKGNPNFTTKYHGLLDELAAEQVLRLPIIERPAWRTVELGLHQNADAYRSALKDNGFRIGDWANDILGKPAFTVSNSPTSVDLVLVTVAELGFPKGATRRDIYEKALSLGLQLCPAEVGPALRLQYLDQPNGEWLLIGMEPIADSDGDLSVFHVVHDDHDRWLRSRYDSPGAVWRGSRRWLFVRGK